MTKRNPAFRPDPLTKRPIGLVYTANAYGEAVADDGTLSFLITVPNTRRVRLRVHAATSDVHAKLEVAEDPTFSDPGTQANLRSFDRAAMDLQTNFVRISPTLTGAGSLLYRQVVVDQHAAAGWLLTPGSSYAVVLTNMSGGAAAMSMLLVLEEIDG